MDRKALLPLTFSGGLPLGVGTALVLAPPGRSTTWDFLFTLVVVTAIAGFPQALLVAGFSKRAIPHDRRFLLFAMLVLSVAGTWAAMAAAERIPHRRWTIVAAKAPEALLTLAGPHCVDNVFVPVYAVTVSGSYLRYDGYSSGAWARVDSIPRDRYSLFGDCLRRDEARVPRAPKNTVDTICIESMGPDYNKHVHYALGANGVVWVWRNDSSALGSIFVAIMGYLLAVIASIGIWRRTVRVSADEFAR